MTEDGWHHPFNGHEFEQTPGDGEEQGGLACCSPWSHKESDMTEQQYIYSGTLLSNKKEQIVPFAGMWMDTETVI